MATVPDPEDKDLLVFVQLIANNATIWVEWSGLKATQLATFHIESVPPKELAGAEPNRCWFNCCNALKSLPGSEIVYGWHFYMLRWDGYFSYAAGPHAVIRYQGELFDVTPQVGAQGELLREYTVFMPDERIPFDFAENRSVLAAHWAPAKNKFLWSKSIMDPVRAGVSNKFEIFRLGGNS